MLASCINVDITWSDARRTSSVKKQNYLSSAQTFFFLFLLLEPHRKKFKDKKVASCKTNIKHRHVKTRETTYLKIKIKHVTKKNVILYSLVYIEGKTCGGRGGWNSVMCI